MFTPSKLVIFIALSCAPGTGQTSSPAAQQTPAPVGAASTGQGSPDKPEEYALEPIEISKVTYPPAAKEQKVQGKVVGMILVSEIGGVESIHFFKGDAILAAAAEQAAKQWKFKPVTKDGQPVPVIARATFNFVLPENPQDTEDVAAELDQVARFPQSVRVSNGVTQGLVLRKVNPSYPEEARKARIQGTVLFQAKISKEGKIADLQVTSGPEALIPAATEAVRQWQYKPYLLMGRPVEVDTEIQVSFTLRSK